MLKHIKILRRASQNNCLDIVYTAITQLAQEYTRTSPEGPNVWNLQGNCESINVEWSTCDRNNKRMYSYFYENKKILGYLMQRQTCQLEKKKNGEKMFLKAPANRFRLTSKLISCVKEPQYCLWMTFY